MARANPEGYYGTLYQVSSQNDGEGFRVMGWLWWRSYSGNKTPNFVTFASQHRKLLPLPYTVEWVRRTTQKYRAVAYYPAYGNTSGTPAKVAGTWHFAAYPNDIGQLSWPTSDVRNKAIGKLADKMSTMKVNLAQAFAERKQTVSLVASSAMRIAQAASALRRGRLGDAAAALKVSYNAELEKKILRQHSKGRDTLASYWLELQYGWKPLLADIRGSLETLADHCLTDDYHHMVTASANLPFDAAIRTVNEGFWPYQSSGYPAGRVEAQHRVRYSFLYRLESAARQALAATGITNPALVAWELLPYSFVVDWFIPVGNYIQMLDAFSGFERITGFVSERKTATWLYNIDDTRYNFNGIGSYVLRRGGGVTTAGLFTRTILTSFPTPALPSFKNPVGVEHCLNAISLITTAFSGNGGRVR